MELGCARGPLMLFPGTRGMGIESLERVDQDPGATVATDRRRRAGESRICPRSHPRVLVPPPTRILPLRPLPASQPVGDRRVRHRDDPGTPPAVVVHRGGDPCYRHAPSTRLLRPRPHILFLLLHHSWAGHHLRADVDKLPRRDGVAAVGRSAMDHEPPRLPDRRCQRQRSTRRSREGERVPREDWHDVRDAPVQPRRPPVRDARVGLDPGRVGGGGATKGRGE